MAYRFGHERYMLSPAKATLSRSNHTSTWSSVSPGLWDTSRVTPPSRMVALISNLCCGRMRCSGTSFSGVFPATTDKPIPAMIFLWGGSKLPNCRSARCMAMLARLRANARPSVPNGLMAQIWISGFSSTNATAPWVWSRWPCV